MPQASVVSSSDDKPSAAVRARGPAGGGADPAPTADVLTLEGQQEPPTSSQPTEDDNLQLHDEGSMNLQLHDDSDSDSDESDPDSDGEPVDEEPLIRLPSRPQVIKWSTSGPGEFCKEKEEFLMKIRRKEIRVLNGVQCIRDRDWSLRLLKLARKQKELEMLEVMWPRREHLDVVVNMAQLVRLELYMDDHLRDNPPVLEAKPLKPGQVRMLQFLEVEGVPRATLESLLRLYRDSLQQLEVAVDTPGFTSMPAHKPLGPEDGGRLYSSDVLEDILRTCPLPALKVVMLNRIKRSRPKQKRDCKSARQKAACKDQRAALRAALPGVMVLCEQCDERKLRAPKRRGRPKGKPTFFKRTRVAE